MMFEWGEYDILLCRVGMWERKFIGSSRGGVQKFIWSRRGVQKIIASTRGVHHVVQEKDVENFTKEYPNILH